LRVPDGRLTPRQTGRLTVGRKLTSTSSGNLCTSIEYARMFHRYRCVYIAATDWHVLSCLSGLNCLYFQYSVAAILAMFFFFLFIISVVVLVHS
jgi:hypothetical protein